MTLRRPPGTTPNEVEHGSHVFQKGMYVKMIRGSFSRGKVGVIEKMTVTEGYDVMVWVRVLATNKQEHVGIYQIKPATLLDFMFGSHGFGKTSWVQFFAIQAMSLALLTVGFHTAKDGGWWATVMAGAIEGVLVLGTWMNFTRKTV